MEKRKIILRSLTNSLGAAVYIAAVAWIIFNGESIFGKMQSFFGPFLFLLLFVISAASVSSLIVGKPILLYIEGEKKAGVEMFSLSLIWLALITIAIFLIRPWQ